MSTVRQMASNVRLIRLHSPLPQKPTAHALYGQLLGDLQLFVNRLSNTDKPWITLTKNYPLQSDQTEFTLDLPSSGKILTVLAPADTDGTDIGRRYEVETTDIDDALVDGSGLQWQSKWLNNLAIYKNLQNEWRARVYPQLTESIEIEILYTVGSLDSLRSPALQVPLTEFHIIPELLSAISLLPACRWTENRSEDDAFRNNLSSSLAAQLQYWEAQFDKYTRSLRQPKVVVLSSGEGFRDHFFMGGY